MTPCIRQAILQSNQSYPVPDHCPMFLHMDKGKLVTIYQLQAWRVLSQVLIQSVWSQGVTASTVDCFLFQDSLA